MDPTTLTLTAALTSCVISVISLVRSGKKDSTDDAKTTGQEWGELKANIEHIKEDVQEIKTDVKTTRADYVKELAEVEERNRASVRRLHKRMDDHEREYHNKIITRDEDSEV